MYVKLIDNEIIEAPVNYNNIINFNLDRDLCLQYGYKEFVPGNKEEGHFYDVTYRETEYQIIEVLEDVTDSHEKASKIKTINEKIKELNELSINELRLGNTQNIQIYNDVIKGLEDTRQNLGD